MLNQDFINHIGKMFRDIDICKPLFYNAKIGLRFELGNPDVVDESDYMKQVYYRAITLFEELHTINGDIYLVIRIHKDSSNYYKSTQILKKYTNSKNIKITGTVKPLEDDENYKTYEFIAKCKISDLRYKALLKAIANQDMDIKPQIHDECYFINIENQTIFHLYDDRGVDIVSNNYTSLKDLYYKYNNWILDYDRNRIDNIFNK